MSERPWEQPWHDGASVEAIRSAWRRSTDEARWRRWVAGQVAAGLRPGETVLEVGCGGGLMYAALREQVGDGLRYTGVDNSPLMLAVAEHDYPAAVLEPGDGFALRFADGSFDTAIAVSVLGHLPDFRPVLREMLRVARRRVAASFWLPTAERPGADGDRFAAPSYYLHTRDEIERAAGDAWRVTWQEMPGFAHSLATFERQPERVAASRPSTVRVLTLSNKPDLLPDAIASVKAQTRQEGLRHIVALDDGSRDWGGRYPPNVFWNEQAQLADPDDYLIMLSDDDEFLPNAIADLAGYLDANPNAMACYGAGDMYVHAPPKADAFFQHVPADRDYHGGESLGGRVGSGMAMWRACAWRELGPFPERDGDMALSDGEWLTRMAGRFGLYAIHKTVIRTRMTPQSAHAVPDGNGGHRVVDWRRLQRTEVPGA